MRIANIIGIIMMILFGIGSFNWIMTILGVFDHEIFFPADIPVFLGNIALFIIGIVVTVSTGKVLKKRKNAGKK